MRRRARRDTNHATIRDAFRALGWMVEDTGHVGAGFPDLLCAKGGRVELVEVKDGSRKPSERSLTADEDAFAARMAAAGVRVRVVERIEDVAALTQGL